MKNAHKKYQETQVKESDERGTETTDERQRTDGPLGLAVASRRGALGVGVSATVGCCVGVAAVGATVGVGVGASVGGSAQYSS